jgi:hypothetical protein
MYLAPYIHYIFWWWVPFKINLYSTIAPRVNIRCVLLASKFSSWYFHRQSKTTPSRGNLFIQLQVSTVWTLYRFNSHIYYIRAIKPSPFIDLVNYTWQTILWLDASEWTNPNYQINSFNSISIVGLVLAVPGFINKAHLIRHQLCFDFYLLW